MSLYGQTGTGRHLNRFSHTLGEDVGTLVRHLLIVGPSVRQSLNSWAFVRFVVLSVLQDCAP
jgi:hypothetical protein